MPRAGLECMDAPAANLPGHFRSSTVFTHFGPANRFDRKTSSTANLNRNAWDRWSQHDPVLSTWAWVVVGAGYQASDLHY